MAILSMKKLVLIAHKDNRDTLLKVLQELGAVEVVSYQQDDLDTARAPQNLSYLEEKLSAVREAMNIIRPYNEDKPSFLTPKPAISRSDLKQTPERFKEADSVIQSIKQLSDDMNALKSRRQRVKNRIHQLSPYSRFNAPLESVGESRYTVSVLGIIPPNGKEDYEQIISHYEDTAYFETVDEQKDGITVFVVMHKSVEEKLIGELKVAGFIEAYTKDLFGTPGDIIHDCENELLSLDEESREHENNARRFVQHKDLLTALEDYLNNEIERERCVEQIGETGVAFALEGWIIGDDQSRVETAVLSAAPEAYISFRDPTEDEDPPTAIKNAKLIVPFEAVTDMYSIPSSRGFDPNFIMSFFYFLLFGMMIGDFAYGVILTIGAYIVLKLKKPTGMFRKVTTIIMICGVSTALWGLFFGSIFSIEGVPAIINPINDAMTLLVLCLGVGVFHIIAGLIVGAYISIKRGKVWDAIFDKVSWIMVLAGAAMVAIGGTIGSVGTYLALAGLAIVFLTNGRDRKGIFRKLIGGFSGVYGATGYISDILSYCRLFGMGLATGVISMVFNTIASLFFGNVVGYILGSIVLIIGHVFNIGINSLGAFVHTARLQFIEFYSRFYEGGGHAFAPLSIKTKNYRLEDE